MATLEEVARWAELVTRLAQPLADRAAVLQRMHCDELSLPDMQRDCVSQIEQSEAAALHFARHCASTARRLRQPAKAPPGTMSLSQLAPTLQRPGRLAPQQLAHMMETLPLVPPDATAKRGTPLGVAGAMTTLRSVAGTNDEASASANDEASAQIVPAARLTTDGEA